MNLLERYGKMIGRYPWFFVAVIIAATLVMGYFSQDFRMGSEENAFTPDDEVSRANQRVQDDYGSQSAQITTLIRTDGNILSAGSILEQIELESAIKNSTGIMDMIVPTAEDPDGITYPGDIVVQSIFFTVAAEEAEKHGGVYGFTDQDNGTACLGRESILNSFVAKGYSLEPDEKRTIIEGGEIAIPVNCPDGPVFGEFILAFQPYDIEKLPEILSAAPMAVALDYLLSGEYTVSDPYAERGLFVVYIRDDMEPEEALEVEEKLDSLGEDIEAGSVGIDFITLGDEIVNKRINEASGATQGLLFTLAMVAIVIVLLIVFRSLFEIVINVVGLFMAVLWVFGVGGILGFDYNPSLTTVPVLVIGLGVDYGIHLTLRYREELRKKKSVIESLSSAERYVGFAILLATVTTLTGFLSNLSANSPAIRTFGVLNAAGILSAFIIMMTFVPAARVIRDRRLERKGKPILREVKKNGFSLWGYAVNRARSLGMEVGDLGRAEGMSGVNRVLSAGSYLALHPIPVVAVVLILTGIGVYGGAQLEPTFDFRDFLPDGVEESDALKSVVSDFDFSSEEAYILVEGNVADPEVVLASIRVEESASKQEDTVESRPVLYSISLGRALADPSSSEYNGSFSAIWHDNLDRDFDGSIDEGFTMENVSRVYDALLTFDKEQAARVLRKGSSGEYTGMVIRIPVNSRGGERSEEIRSQVKDSADPLEELEGGKLERVTPTGGPLVQQAILEAISNNQYQSVLITFLVSLFILTIIFMITKRSILLGAVTILPLVFVIAWTLGAMYFLGIPLNVVTVTISAITVGLGIDYSVHVTQRFVEELKRMEDGICALSVAVSHTGTALLGSALTTVIGFAILSFAIIPPLAQFGQVTALSVAFAFISSVLVLPTFLLLWLRLNRWYRVNIRKEEVPELSGTCEEDEPDK